MADAASTFSWADLWAAIQPFPLDETGGELTSTFSAIVLVFFAAVVLGELVLLRRVRRVEKIGRVLGQEGFDHFDRVFSEFIVEQSDEPPSSDEAEVPPSFVETFIHWCPDLAHSASELAEATFRRGKGRFNSHQAADFFDVEVLRRDSALVPASVRDAAPGLLTALGIFGTFVGLVYALGGLDLTTVGAEDSGQLDQLVAGLRISFRTSVLGLLCSILATLAGRWVWGRATTAIDHLCDIIDARVERCIEQDILASIEELSDGTRTAVMQLNTDLSEALEKALTQAVEKHLAPEFRKMTKITQQMASASSEAQVEGIEKIIQKVVDGLDQAIGKNLREAGEKFVEFARFQQQALDEWKQGLSAMSDAALAVKVATDKQTDAAQSLDKTAEGLGQVITQIRSAGGQMTVATKGLLVAVDSVAMTLSGLEDAEKHQVEVANSLQTLAGELAEEARRQAGERKAVTAEMRSLVEALDGGLQRFVDSFRPGIEETMRQFDAELAKAVQRFGVSVNQLRELLDDLEDVIREAATPPVALDVDVDEEELDIQDEWGAAE